MQKPLFLHPHGAVAQSVEQRTENPCVGGSIPPHTTEEGFMRKYETLFVLETLPGFYRRSKDFPGYNSSVITGLMVVKAILTVLPIFPVYFYR